MNETSVPNSQQIGLVAENDACNYLLAHGLTLVAKNYRCSYGEIDLIMDDQDILVFVEVRLRNNSDFGSSMETVGARKKSRLIRSALHYLQHHQLIDKKQCRFDVIGIDHHHEMIWIKNAFDAK